MPDPRWDLSPLDPGAGPTLPGLTLGRLLGRGGFGAVYEATDAAGRPVAVKVLAREVSTVALVRFEREAELLARLRHPGILAVHAWGPPADGAPAYLVCERIEGARTIDEAAAGLDLDARLDLVDQAARGVGAAHAAGVVHRDLKPQNLLVDGAGRVKVIDFGVSIGEGTLRITGTGHFVGTPLFAPPERWFVEPGVADAPSGDVWALAAVAYLLVAGRHPYPAEQLTDLGRRVLEPPASPRSLAPALSRAVADLLVRSLSPDPARRPPDATAFADELAAARAGREARGPARGIAPLAGGLALAALALWWASSAPPPERPPERPPAEAARPAAPPLSPAAAEREALALARAGAWAGVAPLLSGRAEPALARLRGLGALYGGDPARAELDLDPTDPHLVIARTATRVAAVTTFPAEPELLGALEEALAAAQALGRDEVGGPAARARVQAAVRDAFLVLPGVLVDEDLARRRALAARAARLSDDGDLCEGVRLAAWWAEYVDGAPRLTGRDDRWLVLHAAGRPRPGPWLARQPPRLQALAGCVDLVAQARAPGPPLADELLEDALARLPDLEGLGPPGQALAHAARSAAALWHLEQVCRARRRGAPDEEPLARGRALVEALEQDGTRRSADDLALLAAWRLVTGDAAAARALLDGDGRPATLVLRAECDLALGDLEGARRRVALLGERAPRDEPWLGAQLRRLELHRRALAGELEVGEAARRLPADDEPPPRLSPARLEWHTAAGLADVLAGGWWPGRR